MGLGAVVAIGLAALAAPADAPPTTVPGVTVTAPERPSVEVHRLYDFVGHVARASLDGHFARWALSEHICPLVIGSGQLEPLFSQRIRDQAHDLGITVGGPHCEADIVVIMTDQPGPLLTQLRKQRPAIFGTYMVPELNALITKAEPVRIWQVSLAQPGNGGPENDTSPDGGPPALSPRFDHQIGSHITTLSRQVTASVLLVVDLKAVQGVRADALADYLTMAAFANIDQDADLGGAPTILNLFRDRVAGAAAPTALTDWDRAYLKGLYGTRTDLPAGQQGASIVQVMAGSLAASAPTASAPDRAR